MKIIVGLGNPGKEYEKTRHNVGFRVLDKVSDKLGIEVNKSKFKGIYGSKGMLDKKIILCKPQTYMNLSGDCIVELLNYYKADIDDLIVIYDDIDIAVGSIRIKPSGSPGTHNGMKDITKKIGSKDFIRVRIGTGKPTDGRNLADYVLSKFTKEEEKIIEDITTKAADAVLEIINYNVEKAMNDYNS